MWGKEGWRCCRKKLEYKRSRFCKNKSGRTGPRLLRNELYSLLPHVQYPSQRRPGDASRFPREEKGWVSKGTVKEIPKDKKIVVIKRDGKSFLERVREKVQVATVERAARKWLEGDGFTRERDPHADANARCSRKKHRGKAGGPSRPRSTRKKRKAAIASKT